MCGQTLLTFRMQEAIEKSKSTRLLQPHCNAIATPRQPPSINQYFKKCHSLISISDIRFSSPPSLLSGTFCMHFIFKRRLAGLTAVSCFHPLWSSLASEAQQCHMWVTPAVIARVCGLYNHQLSFSAYRNVFRLSGQPLWSFLFLNPSFSLFRHLMAFYSVPLLSYFIVCTPSFHLCACQTFHHSHFFSAPTVRWYSLGVFESNSILKGQGFYCNNV